jgi:hypothetical protein
MSDALPSGWLCASFKDVEHACQQCGTAVEDGRPFCPQCRAPQIHVQVAIPDAGAVTSLNSAVEAFSPNLLEDGNSDRTVLSGRVLDNGIAVRAVLKAGLLGILVGAIPFIGMALTGALAVFFYRRKSGSAPPPALGARLGGAAGLVLFLVGALFAIAIIASHSQQQTIDMMMATFQKLGVNTADPEIRASFGNVFTSSGQAVAFFVAIVPSSIGGALASLFMRSGGRR